MSRLSIRMKIMLAFMLLFAVALAAIFLWVYQFAAGVSLANLRENLITSAKVTAYMIDPAELVQAQAGDASARANITDILNLTLDSNDNGSEVYVMVPTSPDSQEFNIILDVYNYSDGENNNVDENLLYDATGQPEIQAALAGPTSSPKIREDEYGIWLSGYAPIQDESGQTIGIAGVDMMGEDVLYVRHQILLASIIAFVLALAGVFLVAYFISGAITRSMRAITGAARTLEQGEPFEPASLEAVAKGSDEIGQLARVFSQMAIQVQAREQKLKQEIQQLRIEIDEKKRVQEVSQIVDTEYFRDLKKKAKGLRDKKD